MILSASHCVYGIQSEIPPQSIPAGAALGAEEPALTLGAGGSAARGCEVLRNAVVAETSPGDSPQHQMCGLKLGQLPGQSWAEGSPKESV